MLLPNDDFWPKFKARYGAISTAESIALYNLVLISPDGIILEAGSYKGKSSSVIASAISFGKLPTSLILVDPEFSDNEWRDDVIKFVFNFLDKNVLITSENSSLDMIPKFDKYAFVFIDSGTHCDNLAIDESRLLKDKMIPGGIIAYHDFGNQFQKPREAAEYLVSTGEYDWVNIDWNEIFDYVRTNNLEENNNSWHEKGSNEFPCYIGAVRKK